MSGARLWITFALALGPAGLVGCSSPPPPTDLEDRPVPPIHTPRWAFSPWISKDISTGADTMDFVSGFRARGIPVGVVVLDSPWETSYNSLQPNPARYPDFGGMVRALAADGVRTVLWLTPLINEESFDLEPGGDTYRGPSPNFAEALERGYFVNGGERYFWWKGKGAALDFFNPAAVRWWHRQLDPLLDLGVAGWKLDFGESYITTSEVQTAMGPVPHQAYSEAYYRDFYAYGAHRQGADEHVTMVRAYDRSYQFEGRFFARPEHAPVIWAGDNRRDWVGLADALDHVFRSAAAGYQVLGTDIGGYLDKDDQDLLGPTLPFDVEVFARWTALGALMPFMQLHGRANITPWTVPERSEEVVRLYRYWSVLHEELVPFFYSLTQEAYAGGPSVLRPVGGPESWAGDYRYLLGEAFLVAPLLDGSGQRAVRLPEGTRWFDWWAPDQAPHEGGSTVTSSLARALQRIPLFVREGALLPAEIRSAETGLLDSSAAGALSLLAYPGPGSDSRFTVHEDTGALSLRMREEAGEVELELPPLSRPLCLRVVSTLPLAAAALDGSPLPLRADRAAWAAAPLGVLREGPLLLVRLPASPAPARLRLTPG